MCVCKYINSGILKFSGRTCTWHSYGISRYYLRDVLFWQELGATLHDVLIVVLKLTGRYYI